MSDMASIAAAVVIVSAGTAIASLCFLWSLVMYLDRQWRPLIRAKWEAEAAFRNVPMRVRPDLPSTEEGGRVYPPTEPEDEEIEEVEPFAV